MSLSFWSGVAPLIISGSALAVSIVSAILTYRVNRRMGISVSAKAGYGNGAQFMSPSLTFANSGRDSFTVKGLVFQGKHSPELDVDEGTITYEDGQPAKFPLLVEPGCSYTLVTSETPPFLARFGVRRFDDKVTWQHGRKGYFFPLFSKMPVKKGNRYIFRYRLREGVSWWWPWEWIPKDDGRYPGSLPE